MFKIIEDASVPRGTVRFKPCGGWHGPISAASCGEGLSVHNVYVNPKDILDTVMSPYVKWVDEDGTFHLEAT